MSANLEGVCPHCGSLKRGTMTTYWQDYYQCGTVYPKDGPHRRGEICVRLCKGMAAEKALDEWIEKTNWVQANKSGLFNDMLGWHRADCMTVAIDHLRAELARLQTGVAVVPNLTEDEVDRIIQQRDHWEGKATDLAEAVGRLLGVDVGEHSNANCPVQEAMTAIDEEMLRRARRSDAGRVEVPELTAEDFAQVTGREFYNGFVDGYSLARSRSRLSPSPQPSADVVVRTGKAIPDGVPCGHPGCLHHVSHPCEGCGRVAGRSADVVVVPRAEWEASQAFAAKWFSGCDEQDVRAESDAWCIERPSILRSSTNHDSKETP